MSYVRRYLIPLLLCPGVVVHELAHLLICWLFRVPVSDVALFRFGDPAGYVEHQIPRSYTTRIFIAIAPLLVNTAAAASAFWWSTQTVDLYSAVSIYFGVVSLASSLPSTIDAKGLFPYTRWGYLHPLFYLSLPLIGVLLLVNRLRPYGFQVVYTLSVSGAFLIVFFTDIVHFSDLISFVNSVLQ